ncbi:MAG: SRPBCC family protein [Candidatus Sericytochromatia bacterium]
MANTRRARIIAAAPQDIWNVLADFGSISAWADNVDHSCILTHGPGGGPVGTTRRIQAGRNTLVERITEFDPPHTVAYDIEGLPERLGHVANRWTLSPTAAGTHVTLTSTVEIGSRPTQQLAELLFCRVLARQSDCMLDGLASRLEKSRV